MKSKEEIEQLAKEQYLKRIDSFQTNDFKDGVFVGYTQCQQDMADKIAELKIICQEYSKDVKALNNMLNSLNKQDSEQLCECSSKILPNGKIQLHLCKKCNEELFKES